LAWKPAALSKDGRNKTEQQTEKITLPKACGKPNFEYVCYNEVGGRAGEEEWNIKIEL